MYYEKVGRVYGQASGRAIEPDYPDAGLDIQPKVDEYRIVGATSGSVGISTVTASGTTVTVTLSSALDGLDTNTPIVVDGISATGYDGKFVVSERVSSTQFKYKFKIHQIDLTPSVAGATVVLLILTPLLLHLLTFSTYLCVRILVLVVSTLMDLLQLDIKSMVVAQFTRAIGLQKDDNAFVLYNSTTGEWEDKDDGKENLSTNSRAQFKIPYIRTSILRHLIMPLSRTYLSLLLDMLSTLCVNLVVICQSPTLTPTLDLEH